MSLDLSRLAEQVEQMAVDLKAEREGWNRRFQRAVAVFHEQAADLDSLKSKIANAKTSWLVAGITAGLNTSCKPVPCPHDFAVLATDGSQVEVDRHGPARCYVINTGSVLLRYGGHPGAVLTSDPVLYAGNDDLVITDPASSAEHPVERGLLGFKRAVAECTGLADLAAESPAGLPSLALMDGTLIMWGLAGHAFPEYVRNALLDKGFLPALDRLRELSRQGGPALASYISLPRSTDIVNALRIAVCPHQKPDCDRNCPRSAPAARECDMFAGIQDRDLFSALLETGERSASFTSASSIVEKHYGPHQVRFFYLNTCEEIARVEIPRWVEEDGGLDLVHTLVLEQCRLGGGYPVALAEAHEQAVVTAADREQFRQLLEASLSSHHLRAVHSEKSLSKQTRWV
ncbi:MAG: DNA double-strand break repair nuclease NurA [Dehalococcoidia bacterium]|nr:DNA double-strand break repair nuclease NurA [Dehalococcoidia bacterium]